MQKGIVRTLKLLVVIAIAGAFLWYLVVSPMITFKNNESKFSDAARRYYELNPDKLPTGERVATLSLNTLYKQSYLKEDFYAPHSKTICSVEDSWVKVRKVNNEYKYYVYLQCGLISSSVDHKGPEIKLNGKTEEVISIGDSYKDPGIKSVVDNTDGKIDVSNVTVKGDVDTSKVGTYEITYTAFDALKNKSVVKRTITVVKRINGVVKNDLKDMDNYVGNPENNYIRLSNMLFRMYGLDENDNVIIVASQDIANVNYTKLEKWLDEVYISSFTEEAKKMLIESKFCNMSIDETDLDTTQCTKYTDKRYAYVPSIIDINKANNGYENFLKPTTMSWTANSKDKKKAYVIRDIFYGEASNQTYYLDDSSFNYGVRPKLVLKGDSLVVDGDGSYDNPYTFGETKAAKGGSHLNERYVGEYVVINDVLWRIVKVESDGSVKIISDDTLGDTFDRPLTTSSPESDSIVYNPKDKASHAYYINNKLDKYFDSTKLINHEVEVPVYGKTIVYGEEKKTEKYKVKLSAPNMYEMFSAQTAITGYQAHSYWLINTAPEGDRIAGTISDTGVPINERLFEYSKFGVRVVGYLSKDTVISSGKGTYSSPYKLK